MGITLLIAYIIISIGVFFGVYNLFASDYIFTIIKKLNEMYDKKVDVTFAEETLKASPSIVQHCSIILISLIFSVLWVIPVLSNLFNTKPIEEQLSIFESEERNKIMESKKMIWSIIMSELLVVGMVHAIMR